jgi:integrase
VAENINTGTWKQGQDQESDECLVLSRKPVGVDRRNPIKSVRQSAKRMRTPDVLTPEEIMALLKNLPAPLRTAAELDAFTGLRRGELIGLQWEDVDFENLVIHVRRSS